MHVDAYLAALVLRGELDGGARPARVDGGDRRRGVGLRPPLRKIASLKKNLRRVDEPGALASHLLVLSLRKGGAGEPVLPPEAVPVVHMQPERNDPIGPRFQLRQPAVG